MDPDRWKVAGLGRAAAPFIPAQAEGAISAAKLSQMNDMTRFLGKIALVALATAIPVTAAAQASIEGRWRNPKGSVVVRITPCGNTYCGTVVDASDKAKASARNGGTPRLIGTRILSGVRRAGDGTFKGQAFDPKRNIRAPATIRQVGPNTIDVRGCALAGMLLCKEQRWTRVS
jgi:uncharacterized protein (DUF2147 family)